MYNHFSRLIFVILIFTCCMTVSAEKTAEGDIGDVIDESFNYSDGSTNAGFKVDDVSHYLGSTATVVDRKLSIVHNGDFSEMKITRELKKPYKNSKFIYSYSINANNLSNVACYYFPIIGSSDGELFRMEMYSGSLVLTTYSPGEEKNITKRENLPIRMKKDTTYNFLYVVDLTEKTLDLYISSKDMTQQFEKTSVVYWDGDAGKRSDFTHTGFYISNDEKSIMMYLDDFVVSPYSKAKYDEIKDRITGKGLETEMEQVRSILRNNDIVLLVNSPNAIVRRKAAGIDKENPGVVPVIKDGVTLVPIRFIAESLDAVIRYDDKTGEVYILYKNTEILMKPGNKCCTINGKTVELDVAPEVRDGRTLVPVRTIFESMGMIVFWHDSIIVISGNSRMTMEKITSTELQIKSVLEK